MLRSYNCDHRLEGYFPGDRQKSVIKKKKERKPVNKETTAKQRRHALPHTSPKINKYVYLFTDVELKFRITGLNDTGSVKVELYWCFYKFLYNKR